MLIKIQRRKPLHFDKLGNNLTVFPFTQSKIHLNKSRMSIFIWNRILFRKSRSRQFIKTRLHDNIRDLMTGIKYFLFQISRNKYRCLCYPESGHMIKLLMQVIQKCLITLLRKLSVVFVSDIWNHVWKDRKYQEKAKAKAKAEDKAKAKAKAEAKAKAKDKAKVSAHWISITSSYRLL